MNNHEFNTVETEKNGNAASPEAVTPTFAEKVKSIIEKVTDIIYKIRCVCCFTSLLALVGIIFFFADQIQVPDFVGYILTFIWLTGVLSGIIACPIRMFCIISALIIGGITIGLGFLIVGAVIGLTIALIICFGMVLIFPSVVTIRYYFNELKYEKLYR